MASTASIPTSPAPLRAPRVGGGRAAKKKKRARSSTSKDERQKLRALAEKARTMPTSLQVLAVASVVASAEHLANIVRAEVDSYEDSPALSHALNSFDLARQVHKAASNR